MSSSRFDDRSKYGPPRSIVEMEQPAPEGSRYAPDAFAAHIGTEFPIMGNSGVGPARLLSVRVAEDGTYATLRLDVPREIADSASPIDGSR